MSNRNDISRIVKTLDGFVDFNKLFPRKGRPDLRKAHGKYTLNKLKEIESEFREAGGANKFHKVRKSNKRNIAQFVTATPSVFNGYFSAFDDFELMTANKIKATFKDKRSGRVSSIIIAPFGEMPMTVDRLKYEIEKGFNRKPPGTLAMGIMNGSDKYQMTDPDEVETLIDNAAKDFEKYASMASLGGKRENGRLAAHPSRWMRGVAFVTARSNL